MALKDKNKCLLFLSDRWSCCQDGGEKAATKYKLSICFWENCLYIVVANELRFSTFSYSFTKAIFSIPLVWWEKKKRLALTYLQTLSQAKTYWRPGEGCTDYDIVKHLNLSKDNAMFTMALPVKKHNHPLEVVLTVNPWPILDIVSYVVFYYIKVIKREVVTTFPPHIRFESR